MSTERLGITQKIFAVLEKLVRDTKVTAFDLALPGKIYQHSLAINAPIMDHQLKISVCLKYENLNLPTTITNLMEPLTFPKIRYLYAENLKTTIRDESLATFTLVKCHGTDVGFKASTVDFFTKFDVKPNLKYHTRVKNINFTDTIPKIKQLHLDYTLAWKDNPAVLKRIRVRCRSLILTFVPEKEQLDFWRMAVVQSKLDPKTLEIVGIYPSIPYKNIENIKIDFTRKTLTYNFKPGFIKSGCELKHIAVFRDIDKNKAVIVLK